MPLQELIEGDRVVGAKSVLRRILRSEIEKVFIARDADAEVSEPVLREAEIRKIPVEWVDSSKVLGRACVIERPAAVAGLLKCRQAKEA
ncbi:MAG TPA: ribosomal L7Ae/L30e/S12e/Gadd45 family protein [Acetomicrobium flavidum]|uniref:ribosomal L7Ae/L30e/S12e/Gadd45 family protein n=1 Tax=Acetomicrobium flavidum TaxID=49896 RepID=UPI002BF7DD5B|nr:ribosomal L7Ae/L30e/S12e/Gadd45 family protein [Acetomicrobium flavidum]HPU68380.1 ribosomal L7Ae/L30e/S12e/Gadd45 family protein [Acetomicrobium flavidum]